jgi:D-beta-D-heptose 7-phosphate kinase/D-beta-D-heptose 1-phosphate adenosyltransferase
MIIDRGDLPQLRQDLDNALIAVRFGAYDILHSGHQKSLDYAADLADIVVVGVLPDELVAKRKGPDRPLLPDHHRVHAVDESEAVDFSFITPRSLLGLAGVFCKLQPDMFIEPIEHAKRTRHVKAGFLWLLGVEHVIDNRHSDESTSRIIEHLGRAGAIAHSSFDFELPNY